MQNCMGNLQCGKYAIRGLPDPSPYPTEVSYEIRVFVQQPVAQLPDLGTPRQKPAYISGSGARSPAKRENRAGNGRKTINNLQR